MTYSSELPEQVPLEGPPLDQELSRSAVPNHFCGRPFLCGPGGKQAERVSVLSATHLPLCRPVPDRPQTEGCQLPARGGGTPALDGLSVKKGQDLAAHLSLFF